MIRYVDLVYSLSAFSVAFKLLGQFTFKVFFKSFQDIFSRNNIMAPPVGTFLSSGRLSLVIAR